jgi:DNA-binding CsgD family transcriptional regulator
VPKQSLRLFGKKQPFRIGAFTPREKEVLLLAVEGNPTKDIAKALGVCTQTVKHYITRIYDKTGLSTRSELAFRYNSQITLEILQKERAEDLRRHRAEERELEAVNAALMDEAVRLRRRVHFLERSKTESLNARKEDENVSRNHFHAGVECSIRADESTAC